MPVIKLIRRRRGITHKVDCYSCVILFSWKRRNALESSVSIYKIISRNNKRSIEKRRMCEKKGKEGRKEGSLEKEIVEETIKESLMILDNSS